MVLGPSRVGIFQNARRLRCGARRLSCGALGPSRVGVVLSVRRLLYVVVVLYRVVFEFRAVVSCMFIVLCFCILYVSRLLPFIPLVVEGSVLVFVVPPV